MMKLAVFSAISTFLCLTNPGLAANNCAENSHSAVEQLIVIKNNELVFDLYETALKTKDTKVSIVQQPTWGGLKLNPDWTFSYIPSPNVCEKTDYFTYAIQNQHVLDTVSVSIEILCENITILSGFSPNGDGFNDTFTIKGIENFPGNSLSIFDFSGAEIYYRNDYRNDWAGQPAKQPLSGDYTYFYVFNDGRGNYYSGYFNVSLQ